MHRLMLEELAQSKSAKAREAFRELNRRAFAKYQDFIQSGVARGELVAGIDPLLIYIAVLALTDFIAVAGPVITAVRGPDADVARVTEQYGSFIEDLLLRGLATQDTAVT